MDFKVYLSHIPEEEKISVESTVSPAFIGIHTPELKFQNPVHIHLEIELSKTHLILHISAQTKASLPCAICNEEVHTPLHIPTFCHTEERRTILGGIFDFQEILREALLLEVPLVVECSGKCPQREELASYLAPKKEIYHPFQDL